MLYQFQVGVVREALLRILLDAGGVEHHIGDRDGDGDHEDDGAQGGAREHRDLGNLLAHADRTRNRDAEGEADAGREERNRSGGHAVIAQAIEEREEHRQIGERKFRHADERGEHRENDHEHRSHEEFGLADRAGKALNAEVDQAGALDEAHAGANHEGEDDDAGGAFKAERNGRDDLKPAGRVLRDGMIGVGYDEVLYAVRSFNDLAIVLAGRNNVREHCHEKNEEPENNVDVGHLEALLLGGLLRSSLLRIHFAVLGGGLIFPQNPQHTALA